MTSVYVLLHIDLFVINMITSLTLQGCLGALDGMHTNVCVPLADISRYRNRKGQITTNTLAICDQRLRFVYLLPGWEGSAGDARILRDAVTRSLGLQVPKGMTLLCKLLRNICILLKLLGLDCVHSKK